MDRGRQTVGLALAAGLLATLLISLLPGLKLAYRGTEAHVAIETAASLVPALASLLFAGRALRASSRTDLLLAAALGILAATNLCFSVLPSVLDDSPGRFSTWAPTVGRLTGALLFTAAAVLPDKRLVEPRRDTLRTFAVAAVAVGVIGLLAWLFADNLPSGLDSRLTPETAHGPRVVGQALAIAIQAAMVVLYAVATLGFHRRAVESRDALLLWVAVAACLAAVARLNYFLFPSLYPDWVYTGDLLRVASYIALLIGLGRELLTYQRRAADAAIFEERRRLARELHDGLAQELAFIRSEGARISGTADPGVMRMATAAERALGEARMAISALTMPVNEPLEVTLRRAAEAVGIRMGARVEVECAGQPEITTATRQALERIVREATSNAVRHGQAHVLRLRIDADESLRVAITDDGRGFDTAQEARRDSFGMISMRERAEGIGGTFAVTSVPGDGTTVEVTLANGNPNRGRDRRKGGGSS